jgi:hypothetical protein
VTTIAAAAAPIATAATITTAPGGIATAAMAAVAEPAVMTMMTVIGARIPRSSGVATTTATVAIRSGPTRYEGWPEQHAHDCDDDDDREKEKNDLGHWSHLQLPSDGSLWCDFSG